MRERPVDDNIGVDKGGIRKRSVEETWGDGG